MAIRIPLTFHCMERKREKVFQSVQIGRFWHEILAAVLQQVVDIGQLNRPLAFMKVPYRQLHFPDICSSSYSIFSWVYANYFGDVLCSDKHARGSPTSARYSGGSWRLVEGFTKATAFPILAGRSYTLTFWVYSDTTLRLQVTGTTRVENQRLLWLVAVVWCIKSSTRSGRALHRLDIASSQLADMIIDPRNRQV